MTTNQADRRPWNLLKLRARIWLVVLLIAPTVLTMTLLSRPKAGKRAVALQNKCLIAAIIVASVATADFLRDRRNRGATFAMLTAGACGLIVVLILWNKLLLHYIAVSGFSQNTFRPVFQTIYAPLYGRVQFSNMSWWVVLMVAAALLLLWEVSRSRPAIWRIALLQLALTVGFAGTESFARIREYYAAYLRFNADTQLFSGFGDLMRNYVQRMPDLSHFGSHYPPGFLLIFLMSRWAGTHLLAKGLFVLLPVLAIFPLRALARELELNERAVVLATALMASSAGILIFPTLSPIGAMVFLSCACLWLLVRAARRAERGRHRAGNIARVPRRGQVGEEHPVAERLRLLAGHLDREPRLPRAARTGQRNQSRPGQGVLNGGSLVWPPEEPRGLRGQPSTVRCQILRPSPRFRHTNTSQRSRQRVSQSRRYVTGIHCCDKGHGRPCGHTSTSRSRWNT